MLIARDTIVSDHLISIKHSSNLKFQIVEKPNIIQMVFVHRILLSNNKYIDVYIVILTRISTSIDFYRAKYLANNNQLSFGQDIITFAQYASYYKRAFEVIRS